MGKFYFSSVKAYAANRCLSFVKRTFLVFCSLLISGSFLVGLAQSPQANLDQANNGRDNAPNDPMVWVNGNLNETQNHYLEGQSIPYRAILDRFKVGCTTKIRIAFDARNSGHMAIDYLTSYNQPGPHATVFPGHTLPQETIDPIAGLAGSYVPGTPFTLPAPGTINTPVPGQPQASFNNLSAAQKQMSIWNGTITNIAFVVNPNYSETNNTFEAVIEVTFVPSALPVVLAWGGHIASRLDWGFLPNNGGPRSAGGIPGSPYHMRLKDWDVTGINANSCAPVFTSIGNQDRSLQISALPCTDFISSNIIIDASQYNVNNTIGLDVNPSGGFQPYSYLWTASTGITFNNATLKNPTATIGAGSGSTATFTVVITDAIGCQVTKTITYALTPRPCGINGPDEVCPNSDDIFSFPYGGATSLTWSVTGNGSISGTNIGTPIHILSDLVCGGQYVVTVVAVFPNETQTCSKTVTVLTPPAASFTNPPGNITVNCGDVPAVTAISYTNGGSGGCLIGGSVTATRTGSYTACGGTVTDTWTFTDLCQRTISWSRTITVQPATFPSYTNPPANITLASCTTTLPNPSAINYTNNLSGFCLLSGTVTSTITQTGGAAPCERIYTETWTTTVCNQPLTYSRTITVPAATEASFVSPPGNISISCGQAPPSPTLLSYSNGVAGACAISGTVTSTITGSHTVCGGTYTETWSFEDPCGRGITSYSRTITVNPAAVAHFTSSPGAITVSCGQIPAPSCLNYTNDGSGGCLISGCVTSTQTTAPGVCGGQVTETWTFVDQCNRTITHSRVITVSPATVAHFTSSPGPITVSCGQVPAPSCLNYTNDGSGGCLISGCVTSTQTTAPGVCGGEVTETWTFVDQCNRTITHSRVITVSPAAPAAFVNAPGPITVNCGQIPAPVCVSYTNNGSGGCLISGCVTSTQTTAPGLCGGQVTESWTFTDACGRTINGSRVITVNPAAVAHFTSTPGAITVSCGQIPAPSCLNYTNDGSGGCLISGCVTSTQTTAPGVCGGQVTETWTFVDQCNRTITHSRVITVSPAAPAAFVNAPGPITVNCGQIPAPVCVSYTNNGSGGCLISGCVTSTQTTAPGLCGGQVTESWTFTDACGRTINGSRVITVNPAAQATFTNPPGPITVSCGQIPAPTCLNYTNEGAGGCLISGCVTSTQTTAPSVCGGQVTETWTFIDQCNRTITHSRVITVSPATVAHFTSSPGPVTVSCGQIPSPSCLNYTNDGSGGCLISGCVTSTQTTAPGVCGGQVTETWTFVDQCNRTITHSRVITIDPAPQAQFTQAPGNITVSCGNLPAPSCLPYSNNADGACLISGCVTSTQTTTPGVCGGQVTETWTFVDECNRTITYSRVITVEPAAQASFVNPPGNITTTVCGVAPLPSPLNYSNEGQGGCLISGTVTSVITGGSNVNCGTYTETWTFTDECGRTITHSRNIEVPCCTYCTLTQGGYGQPGGTTCVNGNTVNQTQVMINALTSEPGNMKVFGRQDLNRYWVVRLTDVNQGVGSNIFKMLPGGGSSLVFKVDNVPGVPEYSNHPSWSIAPLQNGGPRAGSIRNQLFAQTLTLYFNTKYGNGALANVVVVDTFVVAQPIACGSPISNGNTSKVGMPHNVVVYLNNPANGYPNTIGGLFQLANDALGGVNTGLSLDEIQSAAEKINSGFDQCRILVGTIPYQGQGAQSRPASNRKEELVVTAYPNPYENNIFNLTINAPVTGEARIQLFTMDGNSLSEMKTMVRKDVDQVVTLKVPTLYKTRIIYVVTAGTFQKRGIVLSPN